MADFSKYYRAYMYMQELLDNDFTYNYIIEGLKDGDKGEDTLNGKTNEKVIDMDWVVAIEETLPYIQNAIDEQRRFIKQIENVVRIEFAKKVGPDSVRHLAQHTNFIAKVEGDKVTPNKILNTETEDSFAIYENRVLMTLIRKALNFVDDKYSKMKDVPNDSYNKMNLVRHMELNEKVVDFVVDYTNESHETLADNLDVLDVTGLSDFDRIRRIRIALNEFLNTPLMKAIANEHEVRPPLTQTNLLKKNPNFKKAVELWNFLDSYKRKGFEIVGEEYSGKMSEEVQKDVYFSMAFQHFLMTMSTNPGLRTILQQKYEDENARIEAERQLPEKTREAAIQARLDEVRKEEMEIRLREIRDREKKIFELTNEVNNLKILLEQKEQQILDLKGQVSALRDQLNELSEELRQTKLKLLEALKRIEELEEENAALKAKVAELEQHIEELNATIDELNRQIDALNVRIAELEEENARQKAKIKEQENIIAQQTERIQFLEAQVAEQLAKITALVENIEKCEAQIAEDERQIADLTGKNEQLTFTLETERRETIEREERMNADFELKTQQAQEKHNLEIKAMQNNLDNAEAEHTRYVAQLNAEFAEQSNKAELKRLQELAEKQQEFEKQIENVRKSNDAASAAMTAKHISEIKKVQKSVDKRVEAAEKAAERRMQAKVNEVKKEARDEIRRAEKRANDKTALMREEARAIKNSVDMFARDFAFGSVELLSLYAGIFAQTDAKFLAQNLLYSSRNIKALTISRNKKSVVLSLYTPMGTKVVKQYKKTADLSVAVSDIVEQLKGITNLPICITFSGVDRDVVSKYAQVIKNSLNNNVTVSHNKSLKANGFIGIYYSTE